MLPAEVFDGLDRDMLPLRAMRSLRFVRWSEITDMPGRSRLTDRYCGRSAILTGCAAPPWLKLGGVSEVAREILAAWRRDAVDVAVNHPGRGRNMSTADVDACLPHVGEMVSLKFRDHIGAGNRHTTNNCVPAWTYWPTRSSGADDPSIGRTNVVAELESAWFCAAMPPQRGWLGRFGLEQVKRVSCGRPRLRGRVEPRLGNRQARFGDCCELCKLP